MSTTLGAPSRVRAIILFAMLLALPSISALAQTPGCATCVHQRPRHTQATFNNTICPGPNAIVCRAQFSAIKSSCLAGFGEIRKCEVKTAPARYPGIAYPPQMGAVCGTVTRNPDKTIKSINCPPVPANGPAVQVFAPAELCIGKDWGATFINRVLREMFVLSVETPEGPTLLQDGFTNLASTIVRFDAEMIEKGLEDELIAQDGEFAYLHLTLESTQPAARFVQHFGLPFPVRIAAGNLTVGETWINQGVLHLDLRVPLANLGAFADYGVDIGGLLVLYFPTGAAYTGLAGLSVPPFDLIEERIPFFDPEPAPARVDFGLFATLSSADEVLIEGGGLVGFAP